MKYLLRSALLIPFRPSVYLVLLRLLRSLGVIPAKVENVIDPPRHILIVNLTTFVGDTVMMMPLLDRLHDAHPHATIDVITSSAMSNFVRKIPYLRQVYSLDMNAKRIPVWKQYRRFAQMLDLVRSQLMNQAYDLCLLPRWGTDSEMSAFLAALTSSNRIAGHDPADEIDIRQPFPGLSRLFTHISHGGHGLPEAVRELRLAESCGLVGPLDLIAEERRPIAALPTIASTVSLPTLRNRLGLGDGLYMVLAPGASNPARMWSIDHFVELGLEIRSRLGYQILVIGGPAEAELGRSAKQKMGDACSNLVGQTTLVETTALLSKAALLVVNDSGPAHLGSGLGVSTLVISPCPLTCTREGPSSPLRVRPVGPSVRILQPSEPATGCGDRCLAPQPHCILGVTIEQALLAATQLLTRTS